MQRSTDILLTGASGLLGCTLAPFLSQAGFRVVTAAHAHASQADLSADLADPQAVKALFEAARPQSVINLAGLTDVDRCEAHPGEAWRLNVQTIANLAACVRETKGCRLVHLSTDQVYDGPGPHGEADLDIVNVYGLSKHAGELVALSADATVLRTNFFGPSRCRGRASFSDRVLGKLRAGERFTGFEDVAFTPLSMDTLCAAIARVIEAPVPGVYNLGSRGGCSKAGFARSIARHFALDAALVRPGTRADVALAARRPGDMRMDSTLFERTFDFILPETEQEIGGLVHA
ncbi:MAG: SDR family oxidoreductase [Pseudomonadota bacterium]|nr:SDR family oxidoreductase [Pseudomonadota bacterium]